MARNNVFVAGFLVLAGMAGGYGIAQFLGGGEGSTSSGEREILYWAAPMDPNFRGTGPGTSPMGMDLVPVYEGDENGADAGEEPSLRISPTVINNIGVRTEVAQRRTLHNIIRTVGNVRPNEEQTRHIHVRAAGWIESLAVRSAGDEVQEGDLLFQYYSPDLVNAQAEYVQGLQAGREDLILASAERLRALGMGRDQISRIRRSREVEQLVDIRAPQNGVVIALNVGEGMYVQPGGTLISLSDLSSVWILVNVFEDDASQMTTGLRTILRLPFMPGEVWEGQVDYVYPTIDPVSRTLTVRLSFNGVAGTLMPNMYADVEIHGPARENVLTIPSQALIRSSEGDRVILALGEGRFRPARVVAGMQSGDYIEIISGLRDGESIVTSSQFLIDSEASLDASLLRLSLEGERMITPSEPMEMDQ